MTDLRDVGVLDLGGAEPIAKGTYRDVYLHPEREDAVLKVLRPGAEWQPGRHLGNFLKARSVQQLYRFMFREYETYLEAKLKQMTLGLPLPVSELYGLRDTSKGLAMEAQRVRGQGAGAARTLGDLHRNGLADDRVTDCLNDWIARLETYDIAVNDSNPENLLLHEVGAAPRFILVDGFGDPNPLRLKRLSWRLRRRARERRYRGIAGFLGIRWDPRQERLISD